MQGASINPGERKQETTTVNNPQENYMEKMLSIVITEG